MEGEFKENPYEDANMISKFLFAWCAHLVGFIESKDPNTNYLFETPDHDDPQILGDMLQTAWESEKVRATKAEKHPSLYRVIKKLYLHKRFTIHNMLASLSSYCILRPLVVVIVAYLAVLVAYKTNDYLENASQVVLIVWLILFSLTSFIINQHVAFHQLMEGLRIKTAIYSLLYKHVLASSKNKFESKHIENVLVLISKVESYLEKLVQSWQNLITVPIIVAVDAYIVFVYLGVCGFMGVGFLLFLGCLMHAFSFFFATPYSVKQENRRAETKSTLTEVVRGLHTIKMNGMEALFENLLMKQLQLEMKRVVWANIQKGLFYVLYSSAYMTSVGLTMITAIRNEKILTTDKVIVIIMFYYTIAHLVLYDFPIYLVTLWRCKYSMRKMVWFLMSEGKTGIAMIADPKYAIVMSNVTSLLSKQYTTIRKVSLKIPHGSLCVITGWHNSGKNTMIPLLTEYVGYRTGTITVSGEVTLYKYNSAFIDGTLKDNITLHREIDEAEFKEVRQICGLNSEFKKYPDGEDSQVDKEELTTEERSKILLARMLSKPADIYLFDHPPVDVTNSVKRKVFQSVIFTYLGDATRIIVTNEKEYLERADLVVMMKDGHIEKIGTYLDVQELVTDKTLLDIDEIDTYNKMHLAISPGSAIYLSNHHLSQLGIKEVFMKKFDPKEYEEKIALSFYDIAKIRKVDLFLLVLCTLSAVALNALITLFILHRGNQNLFTFYNSTTIHLYGLQNVKDLQLESVCLRAQRKLMIRKMYYYTILAAIYVFIMLVRLWLFTIICHTYMTRLCRNMVKTLLHGQAERLNTFENNRLVTVFTQDLNNLADNEPQQMMVVLEILLFTLALLCALGITMNLYAVSLTVLVLVYWLLGRKLYDVTVTIRKLQLAVSEKLKLHMETSFQDISVIHIDSVHTVFTKHFMQYNGLFRSIIFVKYSMLLAFQLWFNLIYIVWYCCAIVKQLISIRSFKSTFLCTYFVLSHVLIIQFINNEACKRITMIASTSRSMRQIKHFLYVGKLEETPDPEEVPLSWGNVGQLEFVLVTIKSVNRRSMVNITIEPGQKIGIIGKSDFGRILMLALLRINTFDGTILMDGVNINYVDLKILRSKISYISDLSFIFTMSLRFNLDPYGKVADGELWHVLDLVQIKYLFNSLDAPITSVSKESFTNNVKVMLHMAKAILARNRVLILDDVHKILNRKNVDLINRLIKEYFFECTVIKISKRLYDMMDCERVMLMSQGYIVEDSTPEDILRKMKEYLDDD